MIISNLRKPIHVLVFLVVLVSFLPSCFCVGFGELEGIFTVNDSSFLPAVATWYGDPNGPGSVRVTIMDEGNCDSSNVHFDLSGTAFGGMAKPGLAGTLRNAGIFTIEYRRVPCDCPGTPLVIEVDRGSNLYYFACVVKYQSGDGDLSLVEPRTATSNEEGRPMQHSWGPTRPLSLGDFQQVPFSTRLTTGQSKQVIVAQDAIPPNWAPGNSYSTSLLLS